MNLFIDYLNLEHKSIQKQAYVIGFNKLNFGLIAHPFLYQIFHKSLNGLHQTRHRQWTKSP
jgi:hypothetical protein